MPSAQELRWNLEAVRNAIAQQRLEGLTPSADLVLDLERAARGEITVSDVIRNIAQRHHDAHKVFQHRPLP